MVKWEPGGLHPPRLRQCPALAEKYSVFFCFSPNMCYTVPSPSGVSDFAQKTMFCRFFPLFFLCMACLSTPAWGDVSDQIWGGKNQETTYTPAYLPGMGETALAQYQHPAMNLGAPQPGIPVQPTHNTQTVNVPQTHIPMITIPAGPVGSVGRPATHEMPHHDIPNGQTLAEVVYILPSTQPPDAMICIDGQQTIPATEVKVVPAHTPGAVPVVLQTVMVQRPKVDYHWTYGPIVNKTETLVQVVDPRSGRVVRTYCQEDSHRSTLPWLHRREVVTYETVEAKIAVPVSLNPQHSSAVNTVIRP